MTKGSATDGGESPGVDEALKHLIAMLDDAPTTNVQENANLQQVQVDFGAATVSESSSGTSSSSGPSFWPANASTAMRTTPKPKKKRRRDRNRPIHEIQRLQTQVTDMEQQLQTLKPKAESPELIALKEKNSELKEKLKRRLEDTTAVENLLRTQVDTLLQALPKSLAVSGQNLVYDFKEDDAVFQVLANTVDEHYLDMDRVFRAAGLNDATSEIFEAYMTPAKTPEGTGCVLKTRTCAFLPYARELVEHAMWRRIQCESVILPENVTSSNDLGLPLGNNASNLIVSKRKVHLDNAAFTIRLALKEYIEADRSVYVWDAIGDWPRANAEPKVSTREYGWIYFMQTDCSELCILRSFVTVTPNVTVGADGELVERVMQLYRRTVEIRYQKLENALVDTAKDFRRPGWGLYRSNRC